MISHWDCVPHPLNCIIWYPLFNCIYPHHPLPFSTVLYVSIVQWQHVSLYIDQQTPALWTHNPFSLLIIMCFLYFPCFDNAQISVFICLLLHAYRVVIYNLSNFVSESFDMWKTLDISMINYWWMVDCLEFSLIKDVSAIQEERVHVCVITYVSYEQVTSWFIKAGLQVSPKNKSLQFHRFFTEVYICWYFLVSAMFVDTFFFFYPWLSCFLFELIQIYLDPDLIGT